MVSKKGTLTNLKKSPYGREDYDSALEREYMVELERDPGVKDWTKSSTSLSRTIVFGTNIKNFL